MSFSLYLISQTLRFFVAPQVAFKLGRARVVRVGAQLLLTAGGQCVQSVRLLFHTPNLDAGAGRRTAQSWGVSA